MSAWGVVVDTAVKRLTMATHLVNLVKEGRVFWRWWRENLEMVEVRWKPEMERMKGEMEELKG
ncbi:unnamed protein product [Fusarium fujikuroi]|uniref:Uncharacterized protein n=1 Tax=Fusarium fujikuroi TaxID=5127 RepID=A0A9Q9UCZ0_FUSFU|nr:unnamed protein product [Fusarium fujikuroi]